MNPPILIQADDCAAAWAKAILSLKEHSWDAWNMVVTISQPCLENPDAFCRLTSFAENHGLITPKHVLHTIFPLQFYKTPHAKERLYKFYNRYYRMTRKMPHSGWGTYFKRMISYKTKDGNEYDQLDSIISHISNRQKNYKAAHFMIIPQVGSDSNRQMGAPCLNYVAVQVENSENNKTISLLAVYRNHDFRERTYGNYLGLCALLNYICQETGSAVGQVTCVSSHAYVGNNRGELYSIAKDFLGEPINV